MRGLLELVEAERRGCLGLGTGLWWERSGHWNFPQVLSSHQRWTDGSGWGPGEELCFLPVPCVNLD